MSSKKLMRPKTTYTGRIVYERPKHIWKIKDITNICIAVGNRYDHRYLSDQSIAINALYEVVRTSLYPYYLYAVRGPRTVGDSLGASVRAIIRSETRNFAKEVSDKIGEQVGIPLWVRDFVLTYLFDPIYDLVDGIITAITGETY